MTEDKKAFIGSVIRRARKGQGITSAQLAERLNPPKKPQTVTGWERGITEPNAEMLSQICRILNLDIRSFYPEGNTDCITVPDEPDVMAIRDCCVKMTDEQKKAVLVVVRSMVE